MIPAARWLRRVRRLVRDASGVALVEFAFALPVLVLLGCTGIELANFIVTKMRISQIALQIADNASRMGDTIQGIKTVSEANLAETFAGGQLESGALDLRTNGRVILSSLEPKSSPNSTTTPLYKIQWQRCYGAKTTHASGFGLQGATDLAGMGPAGRQVGAQDYEATMFVEVYYVYRPLFSGWLLPPEFVETAAMAVRDPRSLGVMPTSTGAVASC